MASKAAPSFPEYTLVVRPRPAGFFSNFNQVVCHLNGSLGRGGVKAIAVDWSVRDPAEFAYGTETDGNLWERFFEPLAFDRFPAGVKLAEGFPDLMMTQAYAMTHMGSGWRRRYHAIFRKHIRIKPAVAARVGSAMAAAGAQEFLIGVHYRHPAHAIELIHPMPTPQQFVDRVRRLAKGKDRWRIVLATDVAEVVEEFQRAFGARLIVQPGVARVERSSKAETHSGGARPAAELGEQVLVDALMLARCDALVHVSSNVTTAVGYINPRLLMVYCETPGQRLRGTLWSAGRLLKEKRRQILVAMGLRS